MITLNKDSNSTVLKPNGTLFAGQYKASVITNPLPTLDTNSLSITRAIRNKCRIRGSNNWPFLQQEFYRYIIANYNLHNMFLLTHNIDKGGSGTKFKL